MNNRKIMIAPSLLSARFTHLAEDARMAEEGGADMLHLDIMDGHFVPNISFGPSIVKQLRPAISIPFDTHLMISHPLDYIEKFADAGSDWITVHAECDDCISQPIGRSISMIKELGVKAGLSLNPATPFSEAREHMKDLDMLLIMTVVPGFSGQKFMEDVMPKLREAKQFIDDNKLNIDIQVDGGIGRHNANIVTANGGNILVAGNAAFGGDESLASNVAAIRKAALEGQI